MHLMASMIKGPVLGPGKPRNTSMSAVVQSSACPAWICQQGSVQKWGQQNSAGGHPQLLPTHAQALQPPSSPVKGDTDPNNGLVVEASGSTRDHDRNSTMGISQWVQLRQWLMGEPCWLWPWFRNWGWLPLMIGHQGGNHKVHLQEVLQECVGLLQSC